MGENKQMTDPLEKGRLSYRIIGAAIEVHRALGPGLRERLYEDALCIEFAERNIEFERQKRINVRYKGQEIGKYIADLIVENRAIVEVKSAESLERIHTAQLLTYLQLTNLRAGLLINFNVPALRDGIKRVVL